MTALIYSSSLAAAFIGGILALFAPCCIVALLPTFVAATLPHRGVRLLQNSLLFAAGVALILLPITVGVGALAQWVSQFHTEVFLFTGIFLVGLGAYSLSGRGLALPVPGLGRIDPTHPGGMVLLGVASGITSSCCAPVLAGVVALSAVAPSPGGAAGLGIAYVLGMVMPLMTATLVWNHWQHAAGRRFPGIVGRVSWGRWSVGWTDAVAGVMFIVMGGTAIVLALSGQGTLTPPWLHTFNTWAGAMGGAMARILDRLPGVWQAVGLGAVIVGLGMLWAWSWRHSRFPNG